jgi:hypothetical protein
MKFEQFGALFGALLATYGLFAIATQAATMLGRPAELGAVAVGFFGTLFFVFGRIVDYFDIEPPAEFKEVEQ